MSRILEEFRLHLIIYSLDLDKEYILEVMVETVKKLRTRNVRLFVELRFLLGNLRFRNT
jgi:hypothetical protein